MAKPPNMKHIVETTRNEYPDEWHWAHRNYPQRTKAEKEKATMFMRLLCARLFRQNENFGLNGKRGNANDLSQDAISFKSDDPLARQAGGVYIIDVINGAGGSNPQAAWNDVTQATVNAGTVGRWVKPDPSLLDPNPDPDSEPDDLEERVANLEEAVMHIERWVAKFYED